MKLIYKHEINNFLPIKRHVNIERITRIRGSHRTMKVGSVRKKYVQDNKLESNFEICVQLDGVKINITGYPADEEAIFSVWLSHDLLSLINLKRVEDELI